MSPSDEAPSGRPPSIDALARSLRHHGLPHPVAVDVARRAVADEALDELDDRAARRRADLFRPVVNATGVLLHTNLGRAPVAHHTEATASNLELDLTTGRRGSRQRIGSLIALAAGAEDAIVVNNCAAAVMLALAAVAGPGGRVAVSRGELVEIGGAFRVPDVMAQSGASLVEVGTTNRTRRADFERAAADGGLAAVLKVHQSNYRIVGFTETVEVDDLVGLEAPVIADIGSGLLDRACPWLDGPPPAWLGDEPAARQTLADGADLVTFSGDKLLGGPQAGIIAGRADLVARCARHPLARALRPGSLTLGALQDLFLRYLERDGEAIPFWRQASRPTAGLRDRADRMVERLGADRRLASVADEAVPGGGTLPGATIDSWAVTVRGSEAADVARRRPHPVMARVDDGRTVFDLRSVEPDDDRLVEDAIRAALT